MQISIPLPFDRGPGAGDFLTPAGVAKVGAAIEAAGFAAACVTDHPCPTGRWLDAGGHYAHDPFILLALVAAATGTVRLQTGILVLPYRNPFVVARSVATLDLYSGGRVSLGVGAGYLKGEYRALGVDFDDRNALMDEYLRALKASLTGEEFAFEGRGFTAFGNRVQPGPVQRPHPPFLIGGNAPRAIRRAVEHGDAWYPFLTSGLSTATTKTFDLTGPDDLARGRDYMLEECAKAGRAVPPALMVGGVNPPGTRWSAQQYLDEIGRYAELGVVSAGVVVEGDTVGQWCDAALRMGEEVVAKAATLGAG